MDLNFPKIKELLKNSDLSNDEQQEFLTLLLRVSDRQLKSVREIFEHDIYSARIIYNNYKKKSDALADGKDLNAIFIGEVEYLDKVQTEEEN